MFWTLIFFTILIIVVIFVCVISIYYYVRPKKQQDETYDTIVQLDLNKSRIENATEYVLNNFKNVNLIVFHHPRPECVNFNGKDYQLSLYNSKRKRICGFTSFYCNKHYILINKNNYIIENDVTFESKNVEITKIFCIDANFEHIKYNIFIVTICWCNDIVNLITNVFELIEHEHDNLPYIIIGNFGFHQWEDIRKKILFDDISSGVSCIPTYKLGNHISQIHGFISSKKHYYTYIHDVNYIQPNVISNELIVSLKLKVNYDITELKYDDNAIKLATNINALESDENYMKYPPEPCLLNNYEHITFKKLKHRRKLPPIKSIEQILNDVIRGFNNQNT